jgi:hypothetical protein
MCTLCDEALWGDDGTSRKGLELLRLQCHHKRFRFVECRIHRFPPRRPCRMTGSPVDPSRTAALEVPGGARRLTPWF